MPKILPWFPIKLNYLRNIFKKNNCYIFIQTTLYKLFTTMYLQHNDNDVLIPQHISRNAFYSIQLLLLNSLIAYKLNYNNSFYNLSILYVLSIIHWNKVKHRGIIKTLDTTMASYSMFCFTYFESNRFIRVYQQIWYLCVVFSLFGFFMNEYLLYYQVVNEKKTNIRSKFHYFSLQYTIPNTYERELAYYRSTYTHMFFLHIFPFTISGTFAILSAMNN